MAGAELWAGDRERAFDFKVFLYCAMRAVFFNIAGRLGEAGPGRADRRIHVPPTDPRSP